MRREKKEEKVEKEDVKQHLVAAFVSFLDREFESDSNEEQFKGLIDAARTSLSTAFNLPSDDSFKIPRDIEDIFFKEAKHHVKKPAVNIKVEVKDESIEENEEIEDNEDMDNDDDGNWKRRHRSKDDDDEKMSSDVLEGGSDLKLDSGENSLIEDNVEEEFNPENANEDQNNPEDDHELLVNV